MTVLQCVILCGGLGTRLGALTAETPKPLLPVAGEPFLDTLIFELGRQGFREVLLLAGFHSEKIKAFAESSPSARRFGMTLKVLVEPVPAGTAGALWHAQGHLADRFFLINGDTWFDVPILSLWADYKARENDVLGAVALRLIKDVSRYGSVDVDGGLITGFHEKSGEGRSGYINGGVYLLTKQIVDRAAPVSSLERDVLPALAKEGRLLGRKFDNAYFIDIGVPATFELAQTEIPAQKWRPAAFLDRDGVIKIDDGHVGSIDRFAFVDGAPAAIRCLNEAGLYVFIVTNQAGIAKGYYSEADHLALMDHIAMELLGRGAHLDDHRCAPHHPEAIDPACRADHPWRKPRPGMILDLMRHWRIDPTRSFLIGDKDSDLQAAAAAGLSGYLFTGGDLAVFVSKILSDKRY